MAQLSIIVTVYNTQKYLPICIDSLLRQQDIDYEIILVNDGSCDASGEICDYYSDTYDKIKTIHQSNLGLVASRDIGIMASSGKYITFVDADDWIDDNMYTSYIRKMEKDDEISIAVTGTMKKTVTGEIDFFYLPYKDVIFTASAALEEMFHRVYFGWELWGKIYRRNIMENVFVDTSFSIGEDLERNLQLWSNVKKVWFSCVKFYHYRLHLESMIGKANVLDRNLWMLFNKVYSSDDTNIKVKLLAGRYLVQEYIKRIIAMFFIDKIGFYEEIRNLYMKVRHLIIGVETYQYQWKQRIASHITNENFSTWYNFFSLKISQIEHAINNISTQFECIYNYYIDSDTKFLDYYLKKYCRKYGGIVINYSDSNLLLCDKTLTRLNTKNLYNNVILILGVTSKNYADVNHVIERLNAAQFFLIDMSDFI